MNKQNETYEIWHIRSSVERHENTFVHPFAVDAVFFSLDFLIQNRMKSGEIWKSDSRTSSIDTRQSFIIVTNVRVIWISEIKLKKNERRMRKSSHSNGTIFALFFANEKKYSDEGNDNGDCGSDVERWERRAYMKEEICLKRDFSFFFFSSSLKHFVVEHVMFSSDGKTSEQMCWRSTAIVRVEAWQQSNRASTTNGVELKKRTEIYSFRRTSVSSRSLFGRIFQFAWNSLFFRFPCSPVAWTIVFFFFTLLPRDSFPVDSIWL